MLSSSRTFRIFVSSTFSDLKAERNALQERVFPRLRQLAEAHGCRFQAIDLRWGVSEEAALDQQTMRICLGEIERCQRVSPRPNFIVLLGDRFGWRPLPYAIPAEEFERLLPHLSKSERSLACWREGQQADAQGWYRLDENAVPPEYVLLPRQTGSTYADYATWESQIERPLVAALERAARLEGLDEDALVKYTLSATGQEIVKGALQTPDAREHVFCYFREIVGLPKDDADRDFRDADADADRKQGQLKILLKQQLPGNVKEYTTSWQGQGPSLDHLDALCDDVYADLSRVMLAEMTQLEAVDALVKENAAHDGFGSDRARNFLGRAEALKTIASYITSSETQPLVIWGSSGSGKSALLGRAAQEARQAHPQAANLTRFIGATPGSSNGRALLEDLCRQTTRLFQGDESSLPTEYRELVQAFPRCLALANASKPLIIILDALDQLSAQDRAGELAWLPTQLPENVRLFVSILPGLPLERLKNRLPASALVQVEPMSLAEGAEILDAWLSGANRCLTEVQRSDILAKFNQGGGLPLYLKLAFDEAHRWHSFDGLPLQSDQLPGFSADIPGILNDLFWRLEQESNHGHELVAKALGFLSAARNGLSEDEILDLLWADPSVQVDFFRRSPKSPQDIQALPVVIWSRLYLDLEPYLAWRQADGTELLGFYHRQVGETVQERYCGEDKKYSLHRKLAAYFTLQPLYLEKGEAVPNLRKLSEMVYQQAWAGITSQVEGALLNYTYLRAKIVCQGVQTLIDEFALSSKAGVEGEKARCLSLLLGALRLSAHVLGRDPSLFPAELTGYLLGFNYGPIQALLGQARRETQHPWLRPLVPTPDAPGGHLVRTLAGHTEFVNAVALTPDGRLAVSSSNDCTLKVWDVATGQELSTLAGHNLGVTSVALTPDGRLAVSASYDRTLKVWDVTTGQELSTLAGHTNQVTAVALTPDGRLAVSSSNDRTLKVWDVATGKELRTLAGHNNQIASVALTADGMLAVSASYDRTLKVWDITTGQELSTLAGHTQYVTTVALTPDGRLAVSGSHDGTLKVWDVATGKELRTVRRIGLVTALALTPDGRMAISASWEPILKVWDVASGRELGTLAGHIAKVSSVALTQDGGLAVSASDDCTLKVWDIPTLLNAGVAGETVLRTPDGHSAYVSGVALTPDGRLAVSASHDGTLKVWGVANGKELRTLTGHTGAIHAVALTQDGRLAVSASDDHTLKVWDVATGRELRTLVGHSLGVNAVALTPDGRLAVSASNDRTLGVWDVATGRELRSLVGHRGRVTAMALAPDGKLAVSVAGARGDIDNTLKVWNVTNGQKLRTLAGHTHAVTTVALTPDVRLALSASLDETLKVWDVATGQELRTGRHGGMVTALALTPDGRMAISGAQSTLQVWDLASGKELRTLVGQPFGGVAVFGSVAVAVTPDGRLAFAASYGALKVWDLTSGDLLASCPGEGLVTCCAANGVGGVLLVGHDSGRVRFLCLENMVLGPVVVTAWRQQVPGWQLWRRPSLAIGCPHCRIWSAIPASALGTELPCPNCNQPVKLNPFVIEADWRPVAAAWRGES